ncbi:Uncharacterized protein TPAR_07826 [Tolypocladium paradoxum]|uniref:Uncharacterized protein n=1 Tax=Tolypocladium paradoxum TaxID=94208 RepID=A0A2S4KP71_9HYPO|nr:Uncharacterized protein TPAR_07826 [Tolypocladium paradoxum]
MCLAPFQGDDLKSTRSIKKTFSKTYTGPVGPVGDDIYFSSSSPPPRRLDESVRKLCTVTWNHQVTLDELPTKTNKQGKIYHILYYDIETTCDGVGAEFAVYFQGKRVAGEHVEVEYC